MHTDIRFGILLIAAFTFAHAMPINNYTKPVMLIILAMCSLCALAITIIAKMFSIAR